MPYKDKEKERAWRKRWKAGHRDKQAEYNKRWAKRHPDVVKAILKRSNRKNRLNYLDTEHYKWEDVEGYDGWTINTEVHHRREGIGYSVAQLKEQGQYYGCRADELICVTHAEHSRIHQEINKFFHRGNYNAHD